ncbi:MAG: hypothetical protein IID14_08915 [Candidatus Marinimicrobia bacterium]|nr:hypothetical protein [Candidatus Neomarinimicrobiota bacterium]
MNPVFFTDRDLGNSFPQILRNAGINVEQHGDHFADDAKDEEWLMEIGRRGWLVITHDKRIRYRTNQRDAVMRAGVGLWILTGHTATHELATNFIQNQS